MSQLLLAGIVIPNKKVGTASKLSPTPTYNVDNRVIFSLFVGRNAIISNIDWRGWRIRDPAQVSQLLLAGIVVKRDIHFHWKRDPEDSNYESVQLSNVAKGGSAFLAIFMPRRRHFFRVCR